MKGPRFAEANIAAARIILADSERYPGVLQEWARLVLEQRGAFAICANGRVGALPGAGRGESMACPSANEWRPVSA